MSNYIGQSYLRSSQYHDSSNLSARALLHKMYSTNPENWHSWIFNQLTLPERCRVLELGSGPRYLWQENQHQILPPEWKIVHSDLSTGMLEEVQDALGEESGLFFSTVTLDAQYIPFAGNSFEAVIANHMLYHVPSIESALSEVQRILIPGGCLYAATN